MTTHSPQMPPPRIDWTKRFLFFIPVDTQRRRRALVVGYYAFFFVSAVLLLWLRPEKYARLLPLALYAAVLLGGLTISGPVRVFTRWQRNVKNRTALGESAYDERDIATRDRAHYLAYSALRWMLIGLVLLGSVTVLIEWSTARIAQLLLFLAVPFCVVFLSLPQAILLWTESDLEPDPQNQPPQTVIRIVP